MINADKLLKTSFVLVRRKTNLAAIMRKSYSVPKNYYTRVADCANI